MNKELIPLDNWYILKERGLEHFLSFEDYFNLRELSFVLYGDKLYDTSQLNVIRQLKLHGISPNFEVDYVSQFHKYVEDNEFWLGHLLIYDLPITTLGNLKEINGSLSLKNNQTLKSLNKLEKIKWTLYLKNSKLIDLGELKYIKKYIWYNDSLCDNINELRNLLKNSN